MKRRLDQFLADEGFFESRARARAAVMEGLVSVDGRDDVKPGTQVSGSESIDVREPASRYVSRGGLKLEGALEDFDFDVGGLDVLDVGASTGGFTDCLLAMGAARVIALDVGKGQLHWKLRRDTRVTVLEGRNARELSSEDLPYQPGLATIDVSFTRDHRRLVHLAREGDRARDSMLEDRRRSPRAGEAPVRSRPRNGSKGRGP